MAGDDETALLAAGHVEAELLFGGESEELLGETSHVGDELRVDAMIDDLEDAPILASLHNPATNLGAAAVDVVDAGEGNDGDVIAEVVVSDLGALVFVAEEAGLEGVLVGE